MTPTIVSQNPNLKQYTQVAIRPFVEITNDNMGLTRHGLTLFEGMFHEESVACIERNGIRKYLTGLDEYAMDLKVLPEDEREAKIKEIRTTVAQLEKELASNVIDPKDADFWNKVVLLKPNNDEFWNNITIKCGNDPVPLNPSQDPYDLIKLKAIEAGGFSIIAKSLEDARHSSNPPKFYLDKLENTISTKTEVKKLRNKAAAELEKLFNKNTNKLFYVAKVLDPNSTQYKKSTPNDILYDNMDKYISGELVDRDKKLTAQRFIDTSALDMETLKIRSLIKDASFYKFLSTKSDGFIYEMSGHTLLGRTPADVLEYLKNPLNESLLVELMKKVEKYWEA